MEQLQKNKVIIAAIAIVILLFVCFTVYDNSQTKDYVQSIQYDIQSLGQSYTSMVSYEKGGMAFISFFENTEKIYKDITKAKENIERSNPKNSASHAIKKAALDYADGITKMADESKAWRKYEMLNKMNKSGIDKVQKNYYDVKNQVDIKLSDYNKLVK